MKLFFGHTSPFARKTRVAIRELGLSSRIEEVEANAWNDPPELLAANPLGRIPALVCDDNTSLCDSLLILEYLDTLHERESLFPRDLDARLEMRRPMAIAYGISEAVFNVAIERRRPRERQDDTWIQRKIQAARRGLAALEREADSPGLEPVNGYGIALGCTLAYCDLRLSEYDWRADQPGLAAWFEPFAARPSMRDTSPP